MNRTGDAASCAAAASELRTAARLLRDACSPGITDGARSSPPESTPSTPEEIEALAVAADLDAVADALSDFAAAVRDPRPVRAGRPFPHTALRAAVGRLSAPSSRER